MLSLSTLSFRGRIRLGFELCQAAVDGQDAALAATIANLVAIPHPTWVRPVALVLLPLAGWAVSRMVNPESSPDE